MPDYEVNRAGVAHARELVDAGAFDDTTEWSEAAPSAAEGTKGRYRFPYGDFSTVNRAALIHAEQRASQNDHPEIEQAADELLQRLDAKRS